MTFHVPVSRKGLRQNRFRFTVDGTTIHDLPLPEFAPVASAEALEHGKVLTAVLLACDADETRSAIRRLDTEQVTALAAAWREASSTAPETNGASAASLASQRV